MSYDDFVKKMNARLARPSAWRGVPSVLPPATDVSDFFTEEMYEIRLRSSSIADHGLKQDERGVVWTDFPKAMFPRPRKMLGMPLICDEEAIRSALIFFDRFDVPTHRGFDFSHPSVAALEPFGLVKHSTFDYTGSVEGSVQRMAYDAFLALDRAAPGRWTMGRSAQAWGIPQSEFGGTSGISVAVDNALPIFTREVSLDDVLEFKDRHRDELLALRAYLANVAKDVASNGANDLSASATFRGFEKALSDYTEAMRKSNLSKITSNFVSNFDWADVIPVISDVAITHTINAASLLAAGGTITFKAVKGLAKKNSASPFEYLASVNRGLR